MEFLVKLEKYIAKGKAEGKYEAMRGRREILCRQQNGQSVWVEYRYIK